MVMLLEQSDVIICPKRLSLNSFGAVHKLHMFFLTNWTLYTQNINSQKIDQETWTMPDPFVPGYLTISMLASLGNAFLWWIFSVTTLCKYKKYEMYVLLGLGMKTHKTTKFYIMLHLFYVLSLRFNICQTNFILSNVLYFKQ